VPNFMRLRAADFAGVFSHAMISQLYAAAIGWDDHCCHHDQP
jgi:hypothetical protein